MKIFLLLVSLFATGFYAQHQQTHIKERQIDPVISSMVFFNPPFDPYKLIAGEVPVIDGLGESGKWPKGKKELIALKKISNDQSLKNLFICESNCAPDMDILPENGWALMGFYNSLRGKDKIEEAAPVKKRNDSAWICCDIRIDDCRIY